MKFIRFTKITEDSLRVAMELQLGGLPPQFPAVT
jgi:hypothetical protein